MTCCFLCYTGASVSVTTHCHGLSRTCQIGPRISLWMEYCMVAVNCSVLQGSVLGPIMFISYTEDVSTLFQRHQMRYHFFIRIRLHLESLYLLTFWYCSNVCWSQNDFCSCRLKCNHRFWNVLDALRAPPRSCYDVRQYHETTSAKNGKRFCCRIANTSSCSN